MCTTSGKQWSPSLLLTMFDAPSLLLSYRGCMAMHHRSASLWYEHWFLAHHSPTRSGRVNQPCNMQSGIAFRAQVKNCHMSANPWPVDHWSKNFRWLNAVKETKFKFFVRDNSGETNFSLPTQLGEIFLRLSAARCAVCRPFVMFSHLHGKFCVLALRTFPTRPAPFELRIWLVDRRNSTRIYLGTEHNAIFYSKKCLQWTSRCLLWWHAVITGGGGYDCVLHRHSFQQRYDSVRLEEVPNVRHLGRRFSFELSSTSCLLSTAAGELLNST